MVKRAGIIESGVTMGELCKVTGCSRSTILRAIDARHIPDGDRTNGGHRRWNYATARAIVEKAGKRAPKAWGST